LVTAWVRTEAGRQRVARHGHLPEREIMTGIGPVAVRQPRVRDREDGENFRSNSRLYSQNDIKSESLIAHPATKFWT